jgi:fibro-slime domain-containing protein
MLKVSRKFLPIVAYAAAAGCARIATPTISPGVDAAVEMARPPVDAVVLSDLLPVTCGNGRQDSTEGCDDHNTMGGDGCTALCQVEAEWTCPVWGQACMNTARCGDATQSANEACDDGNSIDGDGCSSACAIESGWQCRVPGKRCAPFCGDSMIIGNENCDDGNSNNADGCSSTCLVEPGATCLVPGRPCTIAVCGNGMVEAGESCDTGALNGLFYGNALGCSKTCTQEPKCRDGATTRACDVTCGNGNVEMGEECDDGNLAAGDGCSPTCATEPGFTCNTEIRPDTQPCGVGGTAQCLRLPAIYRDFKSEKEIGGHPDFFYLGNGTGTTSATRRVCVPNSGGPAKLNDSTARCWDLARTTLDAAGKPSFNATRAGANLCDCQFTDWSHDTNGGHVVGYTITNSPLNGYTGTPVLDYSHAGHPSYHGPATMVKDTISFDQWFVDSAFTNNTHTVATLELGPLDGTNNLFRFQSQPNAVLGGFFPLDPPGNTPPPGVVRTTVTGEPLLCNLWPYWYSSAAFGAASGCRGDQYLFPPSVDATTLGCMNQVPPPGGVVCGNGIWISQMQGSFHNFWFTTEARYLFVFGGPFELQFYGDDDLFMFINGVLVLDLGGVHQRLPGRVQVAADGTASITEGGAINPTTGAINDCPGVDPNTLQISNATCPGGTCDCRTRLLNLGLAMGQTYEIAVFHADRHPTESNYQLTLSGFATNRSNCQSQCGDGVVTGAEECDDGDMNDDTAYGGCTTQCKFGPYCGDRVVSGTEQCDLGRMNGSPYGQRNGCTSGCTLPHYCGDAIVDTAGGEQCDQGETLNGLSDSLCDIACLIRIQ